MFYEIKSDDILAKTTSTQLIDLNEVTKVGKIIYHKRDSGYHEHWYFGIRTKHNDDTWYFEYLSERDCRTSWESLKEAIRQTIGLYGHTQEQTSETSNGLTDGLHPLDGMLSDHPLADVPEVKICE